jgi:hypothetical protein
MRKYVNKFSTTIKLTSKGVKFMNLKNIIIILTIMFGFGSLLNASGIYVSPGGKNYNPGTSRAPLASLSKAVELVPLKIQQGEDATIWLLNGVYNIDQTIYLDKQHSGTPNKPLIIRAVNPGKPILDSGTRLKAVDFKPVTDRETLARIQPKAKRYIRKLDLKKHGFINTKEFPLIFGGQSPLPLFEVYFQGQRMTISRYPKKGWLTMKKVLDNGPSGHPGTVDLEGTKCMFEYRDPRHERWLGSVKSGLWLRGYWRVEWQFDALKVKNIDAQAKTVEFDVIPSNGIGNKYIRPEGSGVETYYALNLLEEISQPGEWSIDFSTQTLYLWPPKKIKDGDVIISDNKKPMISVDHGANIKFQGLTFQYSLGQGVVVEDSENVEIVGCSFRKIQGTGLEITGGKNCGIRSSDMYNMGSTCIMLQNVPSNTRQVTKEDLEACGHYVINNHLHHYAVNQRIYAPAVDIGFGRRVAVGMKVANNLIHDAPHGGILYGSHKNLIEYNHMYRMCQFSGDLGGIYSADNNKNKQGDSGFGDNVIRYNFEHHGLESRGVYIDFCQQRDQIYGNVMYGLQLGYLIKIGDNKPHHVVNNMSIRNIHDYTVAKIEGNTYEDNLSVDCGKAINDLVGAEMKVVDEGKDGKAVLRITGNPGFVNPEKLDFRLKKDSIVFKKMPDFKQIPMEKIGLYIDEYRKQLPPESKVTLSDFEKQPVTMLLGDVSASSERPGFDAKNAFDKNFNTAWHPQHKGFPAWIQIDLRKVQPIKATRLSFGLPERFIYSYKIEYSVDGKNWKEYADHTQNDTWDGATAFMDKKQVNARYLRATLEKVTLRNGQRGSFWPMSGLRSFEIAR